MAKKFFNCSEEICEMVGVKEIKANLKTFYLGEKAEFKIDGKVTTRRVYDGPEGLWVVINNVRVCYNDFN